MNAGVCVYVCVCVCVCVKATEDVQTLRMTRYIGIVIKRCLHQRVFPAKVKR